MRLESKYYGLPAGICSDEPVTGTITREVKNIAEVTLVSQKKLASSDATVRKDLISRVMGASFVLWLFQSNQLTALDLIFATLNWLDVAMLLLVAPSIVPYLLDKKHLLKKIFIDNTRANETGNNFFSKISLS